MTRNQFIPSLLLSEVYPESIRSAQDIPDALAGLSAGGGFFRHFEIPIIEEADTRDQIQKLVHERHISLTCWASENLNREGLSLSALDETARRRAVERLTGFLPLAVGCAAGCFGVLSGPDPGPADRPRAEAQLARSLLELGRASERSFGIRIAIEPLDRGRHKNALLGPTDEAEALLAQVRTETKLVFIAWDSGHSALNGEEVVESLQRLSKFTCQLHLSNPVTDRESPRFGDFHYPVGEFGAGTVPEFKRIVAGASTAHFPLGKAITLAMEVRTQGKLTPADTVLHCQSILSEVIPAS
jgi:sugar phosphate isomerase/epimerase